MSINAGKMSALGKILFAATLPVSISLCQIAAGIAMAGELARRIIRYFSKQPKDNTEHATGNLSEKTDNSTLAMLLPLFGYWAVCILSAVLSDRPLHSFLAVFDNEWPGIFGLMLILGTQAATSPSNSIPQGQPGADGPHGSPEPLRLINIWLAAVTVAAVYAIVQFFFGVEYYRHLALSGGYEFTGKYYRSVGFYSHYLMYAALAMAGFLVALSFGVTKGVRGKLTYWVAVVVGGAALLTTLSRGPWLGCAAGILALCVIGVARKNPRAMAALALIGVALAVMFAQPQLRIRLMSSFRTGENMTRINLWKSAVWISKQHPVLGVGQDNFDEHFIKYENWYQEQNKIPLDKSPLAVERSDHPHNDYLNVLVNTGAVGLVFFLWWWVGALARGLRLAFAETDPRMRAMRLGTFCALCGLAAAGIFQNHYGSALNCWLWWFMAGCMLAK